MAAKLAVHEIWLLTHLDDAAVVSIQPTLFSRSFTSKCWRKHAVYLAVANGQDSMDFPETFIYHMPVYSKCILLFQQIDRPLILHIYI